MWLYSLRSFSSQSHFSSFHRKVKCDSVKISAILHLNSLECLICRLPFRFHTSLIIKVVCLFVSLAPRLKKSGTSSGHAVRTYHLLQKRLFGSIPENTGVVWTLRPRKAFHLHRENNPLHLCLTVEIHYLCFRLIVLPFISVPVLLWPCLGTYDKSSFLNLLLFWILKFSTSLSYSRLLYTQSELAVFPLPSAISTTDVGSINGNYMSKCERCGQYTIDTWFGSKPAMALWHIDKKLFRCLIITFDKSDCVSGNGSRSESSEQSHVLPDLIFTLFPRDRKNLS